MLRKQTFRAFILFLAAIAIALSPYAALANPVVKLSYASGTKASSGDNELVAAPGAGNCLVLYFVQVQNESAVSTVVKLKDGAAQFYQAELTGEGAGSVLDIPQDGVALKLSPNSALNLNLSGANSHNYTVWYTVERMR